MEVLLSETHRALYCWGYGSRLRSQPAQRPAAAEKADMRRADSHSSFPRPLFGQRADGHGQIRIAAQQ
jgi:hypothetical protein